MVRVNCDQCSQTFNTKRLFVSHLITKSCHKSIREAAKSQARNKASQEEIFDYPTLEIVPVQDCPECRRFSKAGLQMYMLSHLASHVISKDEYFKCEECGLKFESVHFLDKHESKKHKNVKCEECPRKFKTISLQQKHKEEVHQSEKCEECDYVAVSRDNLDKHMYLKHPKDICEECGMAFEDQSAVDKHFKEVHEQIKCDDCEKEYETEEELDNHKVEVHNQSKTTFKQFGGGLMMMMVSETPEPIEKQEGNKEGEAKEIMEVDKDNESISTVQTSSDEQSPEVKSQGLIESSKSCIDDVVVDEHINNKNINVFGAGFFMMYKDEDSEKYKGEDSEEYKDKDSEQFRETNNENHLIEETKEEMEDDTMDESESGNNLSVHSVNMEEVPVTKINVETEDCEVKVEETIDERKNELKEDSVAVKLDTNCQDSPKTGSLDETN